MDKLVLKGYKMGGRFNGILRPLKMEPDEFEEIEKHIKWEDNSYWIRQELHKFEGKKVKITIEEIE